MSLGGETGDRELAQLGCGCTLVVLEGLPGFVTEDMMLWTCTQKRGGASALGIGKRATKVAHIRHRAGSIGASTLNKAPLFNWAGLVSSL